MYLRYARGRDGAAFKGVADQVLTLLDACPGARLVIDLRGNGGWDERVINTLLRAIRARRPGEQGRLWAISDAGTFSSAAKNLASLRELGALVAGEATGGGVGGYGEVARLVLPSSGLEVAYATRYWRGSGSEAPLEPDPRVRPAIEDVRTGRDPALRAVLEAGAGDSS